MKTKKESFASKPNLLFENKRKPDGARYTQTEVIEDTNGVLIRVYLWKLRTDRASNPGLKVIQALSDFFEVNPNYFFDDGKEKAILQREIQKHNRVVDEITKGSAKLDDWGKHTNLIRIESIIKSKGKYHFGCRLNFAWRYMEDYMESNANKCPFCAETIKAEAIVCRYCGRDLLNLKKENSVEVQSKIPLEKKTKSPTIAVLLNLFPLLLGLGYVCLGSWGRFITTIAIQLFSLAPMTCLGLREFNPYLLAILWIFTLIDVYTLAKKHNEGVAHEQSKNVNQLRLMGKIQIKGRRL